MFGRWRSAQAFVGHIFCVLWWHAFSQFLEPPIKATKLCTFSHPLNDMLLLILEICCHGEESIC